MENQSRAWRTGRRHGIESRRPSKGLRSNPDYRDGFVHGWAERGTLPRSKGWSLGGAGRASGPTIRGLAKAQARASRAGHEEASAAQAFVDEINEGGAR